MKPLANLTTNRQRGVALIIVLCILVLLTGLIVAFFSSVTGEAKTARASIEQGSTDVLADSAVQMAINQIRSATQETSPDGTSGLTWASQPGAIRTFKNDGTGYRIYKLYSSDRLTAMPVSNAWNPASDLPGGEFRASDSKGNLRDYSAEWVDLNSPVTDSTGANVYPIVDPSASGIVEGFDFNSTAVVGTTATTLPMPVKWVYLMKNGDTATFDPASNKITPASSIDASKIHGGFKDLITARVAFWTDDESSKVNINTAAGGVYWDTPRVNTSAEKAMAQYQPAQHEFQRYPGHPATVSLATVFPSATDAEIYSIVPRLNGGGSDGGTKFSSTPVPLDADRLYASVDELLYAATNRNPNTVAGNNIDPTAIERARFFLTASSRAPEVTLFSTPRVSIWPIREDFQNNLADTTVFDRLAAFASSIPFPSKPYYFQRSNADSTTHDIQIDRNTQLLDYLGRLTSQPVPGFGGNFQSKFGDDRQQILTEIFDYIRATNLYSDTVTGKKFTSAPTAAGWGFVAPSVRTAGPVETMGFGRYVTISEVTVGFICNAQADNPATTGVDESAGSNTVDPIRNPAVLTGATERRIQAVIVPEFFMPGLGWTGMSPNFTLEISGLQAAGAFQINGKALDFANSGGIASYKSINSTWRNVSGRPYGGALWRAFGFDKGSDVPGNEQFYPFVSKSNVIVDVPTDPGTMTFTGGRITLTLKNGTTGDVIQQMTVNIPDGTFPVPSIVTSGTPQFGSGTNNESTVASDWWTVEKRLVNISANPAAWDSSIGKARETKGAFFRNEFDVAKSIVPRHGDFRIIAGTHIFSDPNNNTFVKHPTFVGSERISQGIFQ